MKNLKITAIKDNLIFVEGEHQFSFLEIIKFSDKVEGVVLKANDRSAIVAILNEDKDLNLTVGSLAEATGELYKIPIYDNYLGSIINVLGESLVKQYERTNVALDKKYVFTEAQPIFTRSAVNEPLVTGITVVDGVLPVGRGQKELIIGDRGTGKTAIALNAMLAQENTDVINIFIAIGKKRDEIVEIYGTFKKHNILHKSIIVSAASDDAVAARYLAPYAGMAIAEFFQQIGKDVLVVMDDLTNHADAYRELSLLAGIAPAREAYPGDIFYVHSSLLERGGKYGPEFGGGSITILPIAQTLAGDISGYIPTNLISITDGQIYTSAKLFNEGTRPAIDVNLSVSRLGSAAQSKFMAFASSGLKKIYTEYKYLKRLSSFSSKISNRDLETLQKGKAFESLIDQAEYEVIDYETSAILFLLLKKGFLNFYTEKTEALKVIIGVIKVFLAKDVLGRKMRAILVEHGIDSIVWNLYLNHMILPLLKYHLLSELQYLATNREFIKKFKDIRNDGRILLAYERKGYERGIAYDYK
ncbi:MMOB1660 family gliding motility ATPase complex subunit [[Mycoplasma] mobile]|uniref:ATP synthase alpha chain n=1 Tax=Mycoplasma mobile (strain ATCC 43663 / 163K / NCTC 11711) TaxID=267748 RepID=Q6KIC4_MYCM1|nr:ATP synthase subunit alpha [[Mycoplasma] mobile]AAT27652.1 ATP synthase alpha chain [Mycoplasma mobile 163K]